MIETSIKQSVNNFIQLLDMYGFDLSDFYVVTIEKYNQIRLQGKLKYEAVRRYESKMGFVFQYDSDIALRSSKQIGECNVYISFIIE